MDFILVYYTMTRAAEHVQTSPLCKRRLGIGHGRGRDVQGCYICEPFGALLRRVRVLGHMEGRERSHRKRKLGLVGVDAFVVAGIVIVVTAAFEPGSKLPQLLHAVEAAGGRGHVARRDRVEADAVIEHGLLVLVHAAGAEPDLRRRLNDFDDEVGHEELDVELDQVREGMEEDVADA